MKQLINKDNCKSITGWEPNELAKMTGIEGYNNDFNYEIGGNQFAISVIVNSNDKNVHLRRTFLIEEKIVENDMIEVKNKENMTGLKIFAHQVSLLRKNGFNIIRCIAADLPYNGYYTWARFGYIMDDEMKREMERHLKIKNYKGSEKLPHEIVRNPLYRSWWKENGISWQGTFDLRDGSESLEISERYKKEKNYDVE